MITSHDTKGTMCVWENTLLDVLDPGAISSNWCLMFSFTRNSARVASDTLPIIDDEAVSHNVEDSKFIIELNSPVWS